MARKNGFEFEDNSAEVKRQMQATAALAMQKAVDVVESRVKPLVPVDTGDLRDKIGSRVEVRGAEVLGVVGSPHKYAIYVEKGTGEFATNGMGRKGGWVYKAPNGKWVFTYGNKPQPFLKPGFESSRSAIQRAIGDEFSVTFSGRGR